LFQKPLIREGIVLIIAEEKGELRMNLKIEKAVTILLISTMLFSPLLLLTPKTHAQATQILFVPPVVDVTENGQEISVACVVEDVTNLAGLDIQIAWNTTFLAYSGHTLTVPVESYPPPVTPSTYGGILHAPPLIVKDIANATAGTYWAAASTLGGAPFAGNGAVFQINFTSQNVPFGPNGTSFDTYLEFIATSLADAQANPISHTTVPGIVRIWYKPFEYPELPLLKVMPELIECDTVGENITVTVELIDLEDLGFWDVSGIDAYLNFNVSHLDFVAGQNDPEGEFAAFWPGGIFEVTPPTEEQPGMIHFAFVGVPGTTHTAPFNDITMLEVTFTTLTESPSFPPGSSEICLRNPQTYTSEHNFDSIGGTIDLTNPVGETFHQLTPGYCEGPFEVLSYTDDDGDGELSADDHFMMNDTTTGFYFNYQVYKIACTLNLTLSKSLDDYFWPATFPLDGLANNGLPGKTVGTPPPDPYNGVGGTWYGNFSCTYDVSSVNSIQVTALPFTADEYTYFLTEGVDFLVHDDDNLIELLHSLDDVIINEHWVDGVNNTLNGWPAINYVASGFDSLYRKFPAYNAYYGETEGYATIGPYATAPPTEAFYDPEWPWELEGWWALGYFCPAEYCWPDGTEWWLNYTAVPYMTIDYNTDPSTVYVEYDGTYGDCLAITDANGTTWNEVYPFSWNSYDCVFHDDADVSTSITVGDLLWMSDLKQFEVSGVSTDIEALRKPWICEDDPTDEFFGMAPIVSLPGFPHEERDYCPWHNNEYAGPLPHLTECATYFECFEPTGCFIDLWTQNGGQGPHAPSGMFWPQKNVELCVEVTYGGWPEQNKDVAFEVIDPHGVTWGIFYGRTNSIGIACVDVRLPWPCDDPEYWFGEWCVIATVDCACVVINDTLCFKYDYRVHIIDVELDKTEYKHCEDIHITVTWLTRSTLYYNLTFTVTAVDASGVPFGYSYDTVVVGGAVYCSYKNGELVLVVHVAKFARPPIGMIQVVALNGLPQDGGSAETPVFTIIFSIEAAWA